MNPAGFLALDADVSRRLPRPEIDDQRLRRQRRNGHEQADEQREGASDSVHGGIPHWRLLTVVLAFSRRSRLNINRCVPGESDVDDPVQALFPISRAVPSRLGLVAPPACISFTKLS